MQESHHQLQLTFMWAFMTHFLDSYLESTEAVQENHNSNPVLKKQVSFSLWQRIHGENVKGRQIERYQAENFTREEHQNIVGRDDTVYGLSQKYQVWLGFLAHFYPDSLQKWRQLSLLLLDKISIQECDLVFGLQVELSWWSVFRL